MTPWERGRIEKPARAVIMSLNMVPCSATFHLPRFVFLLEILLGLCNFLARLVVHFSRVSEEKRKHQAGSHRRIQGGCKKMSFYISSSQRHSQKGPIREECEKGVGAKQFRTWVRKNFFGRFAPAPTFSKSWIRPCFEYKYFLCFLSFILLLSILMWNDQEDNLMKIFREMLLSILI